MMSLGAPLIIMAVIAAGSDGVGNTEWFDHREGSIRTNCVVNGD